MLIRAVIVWLVIAMAETIHGTCAAGLLNRRGGDHRARQIGVGTASVIILFITWLTLRWIAPAIGSFWLAGDTGL